MRMPSIIDWLELIAAIEAFHVLVSAATCAVVCWLFMKHDNSVIAELRKQFGDVKERL